MACSEVFSEMLSFKPTEPRLCAEKYMERNTLRESELEAGGPGGAGMLLF